MRPIQKLQLATRLYMLIAFVVVWEKGVKQEGEGEKFILLRGTFNNIPSILLGSWWEVPGPSSTLNDCEYWSLGSNILLVMSSCLVS